MIVKEIMGKSPITVKRRDTVKKAHRLMEDKCIRHLPVLDSDRVIGIVTESDIREAMAPKAGAKNSNSYGFGNITVGSIMTTNPITVSPDTHVEDAAKLIYRNKIGGLPVINMGKLVGIITIMDILGVFIEMMGLLESSSRIDVVMRRDPKDFKEVSNIIKDNNINIISVGMTPYKKDKDMSTYFFRLEACDTRPIVHAIKKSGYKVTSAIG